MQNKCSSHTFAEFSYLNKTKFNEYAPYIFGILADNMTKIAPTGNTREEDYKCWYGAVSEGLSRAERQIILITDSTSNEIIGFFQYYVNADTFVMEEIQIVSKHQGKNNIFRNLYGFILDGMKKDVEFVEAYANKSNFKSIGILQRLGLSVIGTNKNGNSFHFKGKYTDLIKGYKSK